MYYIYTHIYIYVCVYVFDCAIHINLWQRHAKQLLNCWAWLRMHRNVSRTGRQPTRSQKAEHLGECNKDLIETVHTRMASYPHLKFSCTNMCKSRPAKHMTYEYRSGCNIICHVMLLSFPLPNVCRFRFHPPALPQFLPDFLACYELPA